MSRSKANFTNATLSVALVLFLLGFFALTLIGARKVIQQFRERVDIWLEIRPDAPKNAQLAVRRSLETKNFVRPNSIEFISRQSAAQEMQNELGDTSMLADLPNMLLDVVRFNVHEKWLDADSLVSIRTELKQDSLVQDVFYEKSSTVGIAENLEKLGWLTLGFGLLFIFVAVALIHNTIRLALFSNRFLIKNQELVGATWGFIARPFVQKGLVSGFLAAVLAILALIGLRFWAISEMPALAELENWPMIALVFAGLIVLGMAISGLSARWTVRKFLGTRLDDLY